MAWTAEERKALKAKFTKIEKRGPDKVPSDDDIKQLEIVAERTGLSPWSRQIYGTWRGGKWQVETTVDGLRSVAEATGRYAGQDAPEWCDAEGRWTDIWLSDGYPAAARVAIKKLVGGHIERTVAPALWKEYVQGYRDNKTGKVSVGNMWDKMGATMIAKCSEALGLRKAFPQQLSGLYTAEEMMQADNDHTEQVVERVQQNRQEPRQTPPQPSSREETVPGEETPIKAPELSKDALGELTAHIKLLLEGGLKVTDICNLFGAAGLDGPAARSKKAIMERLKALTPDEANKMNLTFAAKVEQVLEEQAEAAKKAGGPEQAPEDEALAALGG